MFWNKGDRGERDHAAIMASFRESMAWWGAPIDDLSDDEVVHRVQRIGDIVGASGVSGSQFADAVERLHTRGA